MAVRLAVAFNPFRYAAAGALIVALFASLASHGLAASYTVTVEEGGLTHVGSFVIADSLVGAGNENGFVDFDSFTSFSIDVRGETYDLSHKEQTAVGVTLDGSGQPLFFDDRDGTLFADFVKSISPLLFSRFRKPKPVLGAVSTAFSAPVSFNRRPTTSKIRHRSFHYQRRCRFF